MPSHREAIDMNEEPYRWLEAVGHRREYVRDQLKEGAPVAGASLPDGILLLALGTGQSKLYEIFDRHALGGLGHPSDLETLRQAAIDATHVEAFTRSAEDVSLRRLISYGLSPLFKTRLEQVFNAPLILELLLAELGSTPEGDRLYRLHHDGRFEQVLQRAAIASGHPEGEKQALAWLNEALARTAGREQAARCLAQACCWLERKPDFPLPLPDWSQEFWDDSRRDRVLEAVWLARDGDLPARFESLPAPDLGL